MSTLAACSENATQPTPDPNPAPDTATYDLLYEQSSFPLNASELRLRREGETTDSPLFGTRLFGIEPTASANGRIVVYQGYGGVENDDSDLWRVQANMPATRIPLPEGDVEYAPALSPDGTQLAYIRRGDDGNTQLWVSRLDGTERRLLSADMNGVASVSSTPDWSPDGQRLAWAFGPPGAMRITIINANGTGRQIVSAGVANGSDYDVDWSPDSKQLAFIRTPNPALSDLVVITLAIGQERVFGYSRRSRQPAWSPDGSHLVFASTMDAQESDYELYSVRPDGSALTRLTFDDVNQKHPIFVKR